MTTRPFVTEAGRRDKVVFGDGHGPAAKAASDVPFGRECAWSFDAEQARGFLIGATSGRTTLNGEGLQHQDGHSQLLASAVPSCIAYEPAYAYELAVILHDGLRRMYREQEDVLFYLTVHNENYPHLPMPVPSEEVGVEAGILRGMYRLRPSALLTPDGNSLPTVQLLGSGPILREVLAGADLLERDFRVAADVWSVTSFTELRRDGLEVERWNRLHPDQPRRMPWVTTLLQRQPPGPVIAASDWMKVYGDQIRAFVPRRYTVLGTDGFGRSDTRERLRRFFEVDRHHVAVAALSALADEGLLDRGVATGRSGLMAWTLIVHRPKSGDLWPVALGVAARSRSHLLHRQLGWGVLRPAPPARSGAAGRSCTCDPGHLRLGGSRAHVAQ